MDFVIVLDLGCGDGVDLSGFGVREELDRVIGSDLHTTRLRERFQGRFFVRARGETLPFADLSFDMAVALVSLPYMSIPDTLSEIHRTLKPRGWLYLSVHPFSFTVRELVNNAIPHPKAVVFRFWVMLNGLCFHFSGKNLGRGRFCESFQTRHGMALALTRAGFADITFSFPSGKFGPRFHISARKQQ